jgi:hypothetical protein
MRHKFKVVLSVTFVSLFGYAFYTWLNLPYRHLPFDNSHPTSGVTATAGRGAGILRPTIADLPYANQSRFQRLDLYLPQGDAAPARLVIWIHGGGFTVGDKRAMPRIDYGPPPKNVGPYGPYQIQVPDVAALTAKEASTTVWGG